MGASVEKKTIRLLSWIISEAAVLKRSKILGKAAKKHPWWSVFVIKIKNNIHHGYFPGNFLKFYRTNIL